MGNVESVRSLASTRLVNIECEDTGVAIMRFNSERSACWRRRPPRGPATSRVPSASLEKR
jgi:hypothetical protein